MATLDRILRGSVRPRVTYNPFSESRYRGAFPLGSAGRGFYKSTNIPSQLFPLVSKIVLSRPKSQLSLYEDRRLYHPEGRYRPAISKTEFIPRTREQPFWRGTPVDPNTGVVKKLVPSKVDPSGWIYIDDRPDVLERARLGFVDPWKVIICLKRKMRKEIMHAFGYAGKTGFKKPHFTQYSYVRCF